MAAIPIGIAITITEGGGVAILAPTLAFLAPAILAAGLGMVAKVIVDGMNAEEGGPAKAPGKGIDLGGSGPARAPGKTKESDPAKAPGKPTKEDGFLEPKKDRGMVKPPGGGKKGWPDKKGNVWTPTGPGSGDGTRRPHGGPHWDVESPGGDHWNVYPGGRIRE